MASTPLYRPMKNRGTSFYAFPGAGDDIAIAYQNQNQKMYFSKYALINIPIDNSSTNDITPKYFNFDAAFNRSESSTSSSSFNDRLVESLRNYVANHEITMKESRINNTEYFYNQNVLSTPTERIFWKWAKKLNLIEFEPANVGDEYFGNLIDFERRDATDDSYFPEILWRERAVVDYRIVDFYETDNLVYINKMEIEFTGSVNYKVGDIIKLNIPNYLDFNVVVLYVIPISGVRGQRVIIDLYSTDNSNPTLNVGTSTLVYNKLIQYVGEVNGVNNVQEANRSYTEVYAHIPDHTGQTPDVLFRTTYDENYSPNLQFPIQPGQIQPEIVGAEIYANPIVASPQNYPGDYYGQFDTEFYTYETASGDQLRRSGDYYGVRGTVDNPLFDGSGIDGISMDFDISHYVKMNVIGEEITNFDQFNALMVNNQVPKDFEYNAILWYYTVEDELGNKVSNLYGVSFVDNPVNNEIASEANLKIQSVKKFVSTDLQDGTAYMHSLNLNYNIINENTQDTYNPEAINSLYSFNLYNEAMRKLSIANDSFMKILVSHSNLQTDVLNLKQLIYTQSDLSTINSKINNLDKLLNLYQTNQITSTNSIEVILDNVTSPPSIKLNSKDTLYERCDTIYTSDMYNTSGIIAVNTMVPNHKNLLIRVNNDDTVKSDIGDGNLSIVLSKDLKPLQSVTIIVAGIDKSLENKKLDIFINRDTNTNNGATYTIQNKLIGDVNLPVLGKTVGDGVNAAKWMQAFDYSIKMDGYNMVVDSNAHMKILLDVSDWDVSLTKGDTLLLTNFIIDNGGVKQDLSDQFNIYDVGFEGVDGKFYYKIILDVGTSELFQNINSIFNDRTSTTNRLLSKPSIKLNIGSKITITKIGDDSIFSDDDYLIEVQSL